MTKNEKETSVPVSPNIRKARNLLWIAVAVGAVLGIYSGATAEGDMDVMLSNDPISPSFAMVAIAVWLVIVPLISWLWWRAVDEHEAGAYREGAMVAAHLYLFMAPTWWLATRAGWVPEQQPMIVFTIVCVVWTAVWFYRKYV